MKAVIVDDEPLARKRMRRLLEAHEDIETLEECANGRETIAAIEQYHPDLIFLDIQMPDLDGFEVIAELTKRKIPLPMVVFVTAFDQHAVEAFRVHALDYLLKPVSPERLAESLDRIRELHQRKESTLTKERLLAWLQAEQSGLAPPPSSADESKLTRFEIKDRSTTTFVPVEDAICLVAEGNYVAVQTSQKEHLLRGTLGALEEELPADRFFRISRSVIVQLSSVRSLRVVGREHYVDLTNGQSYIVTRSTSELAEKLKFVP